MKQKDRCSFKKQAAKWNSLVTQWLTERPKPSATISTCPQWNRRLDEVSGADPIHQLKRQQQTIIFRLSTGHCKLLNHPNRLNIAHTADCPPATGMQDNRICPSSLWWPWRSTTPNLTRGCETTNAVLGVAITNRRVQGNSSWQLNFRSDVTCYIYRKWKWFVNIMQPCCDVCIKDSYRKSVPLKDRYLQSMVIINDFAIVDPAERFDL